MTIFNIDLARIIMLKKISPKTGFLGDTVIFEI